MEAALYGFLAVSVHAPAPSPGRAFRYRAASRPRRGRTAAHSPHSGNVAVFYGGRFIKAAVGVGELTGK